MENGNGNDPGVKFGPGIVEKVLIVMQAILFVILFVVAFIALFPMTFNNLLGR